jgi:hypothetical protein
MTRPQSTRLQKTPTANDGMGADEVLDMAAEDEFDDGESPEGGPRGTCGTCARGRWIF